LSLGPALEVEDTELHEIPLSQRFFDITQMDENIPAL
jgi:hypothetical protein